MVSRGSRFLGNQATSAVVNVTASNAVRARFGSRTHCWRRDAGRGRGDGWTWVRAIRLVSGFFASQSSHWARGASNIFFTGATTTLPVASNDVLFACVYLDPNNLPSEIMLQ